MIWAVIMAGGVGKRFWPRSRQNTPKQLINIIGKKSMLRETVDRLAPLVKNKNIIVVTNRQQVAGVKKELPKIPKENILAEPISRNTAACIGLAALYISQQDPEGIMICLPADHRIAQKDKFHIALKTSTRLAAKGDYHLTIGIRPERPATGFGYINFSTQKPVMVSGRSVYRVKQFVEKPHLAKAKAFLRSGKYYWNSGIFVWQIPVILKSIKMHLPKLFYTLYELERSMKEGRLNKALPSIYPRLDDVSIDYGIMEKANNVYMVRGDFAWSDVGSWRTLDLFWRKDKYGNALRQGIMAALDSEGNILDPGKKLVALVGVKDIIVVDTKDALLICSKSRAEDVKRMVDILEENKLKKFI